jgi:hypothetical protein
MEINFWAAFSLTNLSEVFIGALNSHSAGLGGGFLMTFLSTVCRNIF